MLGLLFLKVFTAWKTSTTLCLLAISHTILLAQNTPLRPPPFLQTNITEYTMIRRKKHNLIFNLGFFQLLCRADDFDLNGKRRESNCALWFVCTHRQCTMVLPSPSSPSRCHWSTWRTSLRKERLDAGTSLCPDHPRYWNWRTIR